jgi:3-isopropylmalate/(R)-2-methylmalate dehydratase small subunit
LLPIVLPAGAVAELIAALQQAPGMEVGVDLAAQTASTPAPHALAIDPFRRDRLLLGVDALGSTLGVAFERHLCWP